MPVKTPVFCQNFAQGFVAVNEIHRLIQILLKLLMFKMAGNSANVGMECDNHYFYLYFIDFELWRYLFLEIVIMKYIVISAG